MVAARKTRSLQRWPTGIRRPTCTGRSLLWQPGGMSSPARMRWSGAGRPTGLRSAPRPVGPRRGSRLRGWRSRGTTAASPANSTHWTSRWVQKTRACPSSSAPTTSTRDTTPATDATSLPAHPGCWSGPRACSRSSAPFSVRQRTARAGPASPIACAAIRRSTRSCAIGAARMRPFFPVPQHLPSWTRCWVSPPPRLPSGWCSWTGRRSTSGRSRWMSRASRASTIRPCAGRSALLAAMRLSIVPTGPHVRCGCSRVRRACATAAVCARSRRKKPSPGTGI